MTSLPEESKSQSPEGSHASEGPEASRAPFRGRDVPGLKYVLRGSPIGDKKELLRRLEQGVRECKSPSMRKCLKTSADAVREELYRLGAMPRPPPPTFMERLKALFGADEKAAGPKSSERQVRE